MREHTTIHLLVTITAAFWNTQEQWPRCYPYTIERVRLRLRQPAPNELFDVITDEPPTQQVLMRIDAARADAFLGTLQAHPDVLDIEPFDRDTWSRSQDHPAS